MTTSPLSVTTRDKVSVLHLDDGKANALSHAMLDALDAALDAAEASASAVVICGREGRFSAGFDLSVMMAGPGPAKELLAKGSEVLLRLYAFPLPVVVAATGHALAGGALVLLTGDARIASAGPFRIGLNEVQIGMPLPILAVEFARDRLSPRALTAATLLATIYDPEGAKVAGYVDEVVAPGEVLERACARAAELGNLDRRAFAESKQRLRGKTLAHIRETLEADVTALLPPTAR